MSKYQNLTVRLNLDQARLVLEGLELLPTEEKRKVTYQKLKKDVELIKVMWERAEKAERFNPKKKASSK
jgi:hypothetical protein